MIELLDIWNGMSSIDWLQSWTPIVVPMSIGYLLAMLFLFYGLEDDTSFFFRTKRRRAWTCLLWPLAVVWLVGWLIGCMIIEIFTVLKACIFGGDD